MSANRFEKAMLWLREPQKHIHSVVNDGEIISAIVVGDSGEWVVCINGDGQQCGCPANRTSGLLCSHLIFFIGWLSMNGLDTYLHNKV